MKAGDLVRFKFVEHHLLDPNSMKITNTPIWAIGLLVEYHKWEKIARILYEGRVIIKHPYDVQIHKRFL